MSNALTVGQLIRQLQAADPQLPVYLAVNPDWPYAHHIARIVALTEMEKGAVYIIEDGQAGVLPPVVRAELAWS
ncbi:hypothetical protein C3486_02190 [Streptomyces sp. Ru73]|uniref:hypothetical protein n=1 Tax=Streptomyces sp. Ru73 TaxID=2080748 RepID=UPI000CDE3D17|nr:hypothetical protein [Streptomyces sp. Ru73]POX43053.1 hypothetical protein C3486_02190 [Streptomyces sp. Ru73]